MTGKKIRVRYGFRFGVAGGHGKLESRIFSNILLMTAIVTLMTESVIYYFLIITPVTIF